MLSTGGAQRFFETLQVGAGAGEHGDRNFTPLLVGLRDDNGVLNARIGEEHGFDFGGVDVFTTGLDEVFGTAAEIDGAVRTTPEQVAHTKPSVGSRYCARFHPCETSGTRR